MSENISSHISRSKLLRLTVVGSISGIISFFSMRGYCGLDFIPGWNDSCLMFGPGIVFGIFLVVASGLVAQSWQAILAALSCSILGYFLAVQITASAGYGEFLSFLEAGFVGAAILALGIFMPTKKLKCIKPVLATAIAGSALGAVFYVCLKQEGFLAYLGFPIWQVGILLVISALFCNLELSEQV